VHTLVDGRGRMSGEGYPGAWGTGRVTTGLRGCESHARPYFRALRTLRLMALMAAMV
jgi:hypothetical protein